MREEDDRNKIIKYINIFLYFIICKNTDLTASISFKLLKDSFNLFKDSIFDVF